MIWTLLTVFVSIIGLGIFFYYFMWYMKLLNMSELAILHNARKKKDDRWIPASQIIDLEEEIEEDTALSVPIDLLEEGD